MHSKLKGFGSLKSQLSVRTAWFAFVAIAFFYLGKHWSDDTYQQLILFSSNSDPNAKTPSIPISPSFSKPFDIKPLINDTEEVETVADHTLPAITPPAPLLSPPPRPPPPPAVQRLGVLDENGVMRDEFEVGEYDPDVVEDRNTETKLDEGDKEVKFRVRKFETCPASMREYIPCLDNEEAINGLISIEKGERFERHCPDGDKGLNCLVPAPKGYKAPIPWPTSRDEVWYSNVPHAQLAENKGGQNWITVDKDKFKFPGGGTQFIHRADQYLDQISQMVPEIAFGNHTRVALDIGCGIATFGAYLFSKNVLTMSIAPKDVHENQIQYALERGVPAMVASFATRRLLYPSQAFDFIHCSRCGVNWIRDDGILLLEVNRLLRAGGYFAWAAEPVYKHEALLEEQWEASYCDC